MKTLTNKEHAELLMFVGALKDILEQPIIKREQLELVSNKLEKIVETKMPTISINQ